jgi:NodT family efflux transporter outer membrane factor (OMF) lipoprotein
VSWRIAGRTASALAVLCALGCAAKGPGYQRVAMPMPASWQAPAPFRESQPSDAIPKGPWWTMFGDADLNALEDRASSANENIKIAAAQLEQARALTAQALSAVYPHVAAGAQISDQRLSGTRTGASEASTSSSFALPVSVSYEVDLFGKRLRSIEAAQATFEASAADLENVRLIVAAEVASDYFTVRRLDREIDLLTRGIDVLQRAVDLVRNRFEGGVASGLDLAQEDALLAATRTQAILVRQQREQFEHAIAVLLGQPPPTFSLAMRVQEMQPPAVAIGLPTDLLERRPDVAEAERQMAAANARIGIARSAYFPSLGLSASGGWQSASLLKLFDVPSLVWAIGASLAQDVFSGGAKKAGVDYATAGFDVAAADYRQTILRAMAEVQDALSGLHVLSDAAVTQGHAVEASSRALEIATNRYRGGLASALDLVSAQQALLANQRLAAQLDGERLVTTVGLIKALGGGWDGAASLAGSARQHADLAQ